MADPAIPPSHIHRKCRPRSGGYWRHGLSDSPLEKIYDKMRDRCYNPKSDSFAHYGGKGIGICREWRADAAAFYAWALANGYQEGLQIDRKKNEEGYSPSNCRWRTHQQNQNNRTNNIRLQYGGDDLTLAEWSLKTGLNRKTLSARHHSGCSVAETLGFSPRKKRR